MRVNAQTLVKSLAMSLTISSFALAMTACSSKLERPEAKPAKLSKLVENQFPLRSKWSHKLGGSNSTDPLRLEVAKITSPVEGTNNLYFASTRSGRVVALNDMGKRVWSTRIKQGISSGTAANNNIVVVGDDEGVLHALNTANGELVWKKQLSGSVLAPALVNEKQVVVTANNGVVTGVDTKTGQMLWNFTINMPNFSLRGMAKPIELATNLALIAGADGRVHAVKTNSGVPLWARRVGISRGTSEFDRLNDVDADPVFYKFALYTASFQGQVVGIDMNTRRELFQIPVSSTKSVGVNDDALFVSTSDGQLNAYDRLSGKSLWSLQTLKNRKLSNPVVVNNSVIVGDYKGYLHSVDAVTGKYLGRSKTSGAVNNIKVSGGELLLQSNDGTVSIWHMAS